MDEKLQNSKLLPAESDSNFLPLPINEEGNASLDRTLQEYLSTSGGSLQMRKAVMQLMELAASGDKQALKLLADRTDGAPKQVQTVTVKRDPQLEQLKKLTPLELEHLARGLMLEASHPTIESEIVHPKEQENKKGNKRGKKKQGEHVEQS